MAADATSAHDVSKPVAITVTVILSSISSRITLPQIMSALSSDSLSIIPIASSISASCMFSPAGDVDQGGLCTGDRIFFEQFVIESLTHRFRRRIRAFTCADPHQRNAPTTHHGRNVREVEIDDARRRDQIGDALNGLQQNFVSTSKCIHQRDVFFDLAKLRIRDRDNRIDASAKSPTSPCSACAIRFLPSTANGFVTIGNRKRSKLDRERSNYRSRSRSRSAAETGSDKDHVRAFENVEQFFVVFKRGLTPDRWDWNPPQDHAWICCQAGSLSAPLRRSTPEGRYSRR